MYTFFVILILCAAVTKRVEALFENYLYLNIFPKCCPLDEVLSTNNSNPEVYECVEDYDKNLQVFSYLPAQEFPDKLCIDNIVNSETGEKEIVKLNRETATSADFNLVQIPKCCPYDASYNLEEHKCVTETSPPSFFEVTKLNKSLFVIKAGLTNCKHVIKDYRLAEVKDENFLNDGEIDIDGHVIPYGDYCVDHVFDQASYVARVCHQDLDVCKRTVKDDKVKCIRKCCDDGKIFKNGPSCEYDFSSGLNFNSEEPFATIQGHNCKQYIVDLEWNYTLDELGNVNLNLDGVIDVNSPLEQTYCFENVEMDTVQTRRLFLCFKYTDKNEVDYQISRIALIFSCTFLLLTLMGYAFLPEIRNLHGKILMSHCFSLLIAFTTLAFFQFDFVHDQIPCKFIGYLIMYTFLTAFMWSNIMCFDIWWTFGSMREQGIHQKKKECRRFIYYSIYCLTVPAIIAAAAYITQYFGETYPHLFTDTSRSFVPTLGRFNCFFEQSQHVAAFLVWFVLPLALIITCNLVLYVKTIIYFYKVKKEIDRMTDLKLNKNERKKVISSDMEKLTMAIKLFLIMGVSWLFETLSVCFIPVPATGILNVVQILFDTINCLQGVFIFCIFVLKPKFIKALSKKVGSKYHYLRRSSHSMASTTTYVTHVNHTSKRDEC